MKIELANEQIKFLDFVRLCATGFACSVGSLCVIASVIMIPLSLFTGDFTRIVPAVLMTVVAPLACAFQGAVIGAIIYAGLLVYKRFRPISFVKTI